VREGRSLSEATRRIAEGLDLDVRVLPMSDDTVTTRIEVLDPDADGGSRDLHFQEYWVRRGATDPVKEIRYAGAGTARALPAAIDAIGAADILVVCPSNPIASIGPILAVPGYREALELRRDRVAGVSPIVGGAPLAGMADRLLPVGGLDVSAEGAARAYEGWLGAWVIDERDRALADPIADSGLRVAVTDTVMVDDDAAESLARTTIALALAASDA
jgi:LPPG:FO 2-phospho-L-lactate transferase